MKTTRIGTICLTEDHQSRRTPIMNILTPSTSTNRPTSEHVLHPKAFQSWRWVFLAAILLAAVAITTFYFSSAQAQGADGAIAGLTLTSTTAGTLTVSWDAASPTPTDYRVDWAKSGEDYKSWKVDDGHVYTAETDHHHHHHGPQPRHRVQDPHACSLLQRRTRRQIMGRPMGRLPPSQ